MAKFLGRETALTYKIVEYDPPNAVTFLGQNATAVSRDRITFDPSGRGTRIKYEADLRLRGLARLANPLLAIAFRRVGERALASLSRLLAGPERSPTETIP